MSVQSIGFLHLSCCCSCQTSSSDQRSYCTGDSVEKASACAAANSIERNITFQSSAKPLSLTTYSTNIYQKTTTLGHAELSTDGLSTFEEDLTSTAPSITKEGSGIVNKLITMLNCGVPLAFI